MKIIADGGSTGTSWRVLCDDGTVIKVRTAGINPVFLDEDAITGTVREGFAGAVDVSSAESVDWYGAGVLSDDLSKKMSSAFRPVFPRAEMHFESDLMAAARALCGHSSGIVCIIGTGSNSCFYDGKKITAHVAAGGFILGDEGSGAYLGRKLLSDFIKGILPHGIEKSFRERYRLDYPAIVQKVYREPGPNTFLASFAPFISEHVSHPYCASIVESGFREFLLRNVSGYDYTSHPVNSVGSIAYSFRHLFEKAVRECGMEPGKILREPIDALTGYHLSENPPTGISTADR